MQDWFTSASSLMQLAPVLLAFLTGCLLCFLFLRMFPAALPDRPAVSELERLKVMFEDAIAAIEDGFVLYDAADRMYICNDAFRRQFGTARSILDTGMTYEEQLHKLARTGIVPGIEGKEAEFVQGLLDKRRSDFGVAKVFRTHEGRWIRQRDKKTAAGNVVGLRTDITELKEREIELEAARKQAEAAARAKSAFLANMSHEIRTPMNGIIGMAELLEETSLDDEQRMCVRTVVDSSNALLALVNDILDFSKAEAGKMTMKSEPFDLVDCLHGVATLLAPPASGKKVEICLDVPDGQAGWRLGDPGRLRQIFLNLIGNAVKFTDSGFVLIKLRETAGGQVEFRVRDTGIGIPADKIDTVFDVFEQVNSDSTRRFDGAGLGLAITRKLAGLMGGSIRVTSEVGAGSEFTVTLPLPACAPVQEDLNPGIQTFPKGLRVLVVDDLEVNRVILRKSLESSGLGVTLAASGRDALNLLQAGGRFDLAILDYQMPGMNGCTLLAKIREIPGAGRFPVVLLSSVDVGLEAGKMNELGFAASLMKPVRAARLKQILLKVLSAHAAAPAKEPGTLHFGTCGLQGVRILAAEDNRTNQLVIRKILEKHGVSVEISANGREAVDSYRARRPDLVLMDVSMPEMNGYEAARAIRAIEAAAGCSAVPIIALTANVTGQDRAKCLRSGMNDFLAKPVRKSAILQKIEEHLLAAQSGPDERAPGSGQ